MFRIELGITQIQIKFLFWNYRSPKAKTTNHNSYFPHSKIHKFRVQLKKKDITKWTKKWTRITIFMLIYSYWWAKAMNKDKSFRSNREKLIHLELCHCISNVVPHPALRRNPNLVLVDRCLRLLLLYSLVPIHLLDQYRNQKPKIQKWSNKTLINLEVCY